MRHLILGLLSALVLISPTAQAREGQRHARAGVAHVLAKDERAQLKSALTAARQDPSVAPLVEAAKKAHAAVKEAVAAKKPREEVRELRKAAHQARKAARQAVRGVAEKDPAVAALIGKLKAEHKARHERREARHGQSGK